MADAALDLVGREGAIVPALWRWEVQDVLRRLAIGNRLPIEVDRDFVGLFEPEFALASEHGLSVYDASYLELALRLHLKLATGDKKLAAAARAAGLAFTA
jgi:predicted nucleic acid-binding protein